MSSFAIEMLSLNWENDKSQTKDKSQLHEKKNML